MQVFKSRDKLVHSPESAANSQSMMKELESNNDDKQQEKPANDETKDFREKLNSLLRQTEFQIY